MRIEISVRGHDIVIDDALFDREARDNPDERVAPDPARLVYAAAHVVMLPDYAEAAHSLDDPGNPVEIAAAIDWPATARLRTFLDDHGFGVAEAMDTAQRFRIGWPAARRLIEDCGRLGLRNGFIAGAGVDHLDAIGSHDELVAGVVHQIEVIQAAGGQAIVLPMPWLTRVGAAADANDFVRVYGDIIRAADGPLWIHWLGEAFHSGLAGYFPGDSFSRVMAIDPAKVRGAKLSLLDHDLEVRLRRELLANDQLLLTGDDFNFGALIRGGDVDAETLIAVERYTEIAGRRVPLGDFSHALLGIFDGIAVPASKALAALAAGDVARYTAIMTPCEVLSRWLFQPPTEHYKAGLAFLSWLDGRQENALLVDHEERARDVDHYICAAKLAARAGVFRDASVTAERLRGFAGCGSANEH